MRDNVDKMWSQAKVQIEEGELFGCVIMWPVLHFSEYIKCIKTGKIGIPRRCGQSTEQKVFIIQSTMARTKKLKIFDLIYDLCTIWYIYNNLSEWMNEWRKTQWMHIVVRDRTCILTFKDRYLEDETDTFVQMTVHNRVYIYTHICVVFVQITVYNLICVFTICPKKRV